MRRKTGFARRFKMMAGFMRPGENIQLPLFGSLWFCDHVWLTEGAYASSRTSSTECDECLPHQRTSDAADGRPSGPDPPMLPQCWDQAFAGRRCRPLVRHASQVRRGYRARHEAAVKTIAQGRPGVAPVEPVVTCCCAFISHIRLRADPALGFPCALSSRMLLLSKTSDASRRGRE